jgi:hypothetical protein
MAAIRELTPLRGTSPLPREIRTFTAIISFKLDNIPTPKEKKEKTAEIVKSEPQ